MKTAAIVTAPLVMLLLACLCLCPSANAQDEIFISVARDGSLSVAGEKYDLNSLATKLKEFSARTPKPQVTVLAVQKPDLKYVNEAMGACRAAGFESVGFMASNSIDSPNAKAAPAQGGAPTTATSPADWRTSLPKFSELMVGAISRSKIPDGENEMKKIREFTVLNDASGTTIWIILGLALDGELHGVLSRPSGEVAWSGVVEKVSTDEQQKTHQIDVAFPKVIVPANVEMPASLSLIIPVIKLPTEKLPKIGETFEFSGYLMKESQDQILPPIWVLYGVGPNRGKTKIGVSLINVSPKAVK